MKRHLWAFAQVITLLFSQLAFAGGTTGGGNVVICKDPISGKETYQLLDYYEATVIYKKPFTIDLGPGTNELDKVYYVLQRLAKKDPERAKLYEDKAKDFLADTKWISGKDLPALNDYGHVPLDFSKCKIAQLAIQRPTMIPQVPLYTIRQEYWDQVNVVDRAGLILHEIVYGQAMSMGHKDSINSRYFNTLISSRELETMTQEQYGERLRAIGFGQTIDHAKPVWLMDPVILPGAKAEQPYMADLAAQVRHPKGDLMTFMMVSGPSWVTVTANGKLAGTPSKGDLGEDRFVMRATDTRGNSAEVTVIIRVTHANEAPYWLMNPINLNATVGRLLLTSLGRYVMDADGDALFFRLVKGPKWLVVNVDGALRGTPTMTDVGNNTLEVEVHDGITTSKTTVVIKVEDLGQTIRFVAPILILPQATEGVPYQISLKDWTIGGRGDLKFGGSELPSWMTIDAQGRLVGVPSRQDVGTEVFKVNVTDADSGAIAQAQIAVEKANHPPYPRTDIIARLPELYVGVPFTIDLTPTAADIDGDPLTFKVISGPSFGTIRDNTITGTPSGSSAGRNVWLIEVSDGKSSVQYDLPVNVVFPIPPQNR